MGGRVTQNMFLQLMAVAVIVCLVVAYSRLGKDLMKGFEGSLGTMQLNEIAARLDGFATEESEGGAGQDATSGFPYPVDHAAFARLLGQEYPNKGDRAWKDRWGTDLYYAPYEWEGAPGYYLGSAGPDREWKSKDDLWICRWGEKRWSQNMGWSTSPDEQKWEPGQKQGSGNGEQGTGNGQRRESEGGG
jgi:hypothetical protein